MSKFDFKISKDDDKEYMKESFTSEIKAALKRGEELTYTELEFLLWSAFNDLRDASIRDLETMYEELGNEILHTSEVEKLYGYYSRIKDGSNHPSSLKS